MWFLCSGVFELSVEVLVNCNTVFELLMLTAGYFSKMPVTYIELWMPRSVLFMFVICVWIRYCNMSEKVGSTNYLSREDFRLKQFCYIMRVEGRKCW